MKTFKIYKKTDGQDWKGFSEIHASNFDEAKKVFADLMTKHNHESSNNVVWLIRDRDGVKETGFYDFSSGRPFYDEHSEKFDPEEAEDFLFVTEEAIKEGFDSWTEDVYTWELREPIEYMEIFDKEDFMDNKEDYRYLMVFQGERYFLYNGEFGPVANEENLSRLYDRYNEDFVGCALSDENRVGVLLEYLD